MNPDDLELIECEYRRPKQNPFRAVGLKISKGVIKKIVDDQLASLKEEISPIKVPLESDDDLRDAWRNEKMPSLKANSWEELRTMWSKGIES